MLDSLYFQLVDVTGQEVDEIRAGLGPTACSLPPKRSGTGSSPGRSGAAERSAGVPAGPPGWAMRSRGHPPGE